MKLILEQGVLMKKFVVLGIVGFLAGCAAPMWNHPSKSEYDFNRDKAECSMEANRANPSSALPYNPQLDPFQQASAGIHSGAANMGRAFGIQNYLNNCLTAKGYYQVKR